MSRQEVAKKLLLGRLAPPQRTARPTPAEVFARPLGTELADHPQQGPNVPGIGRPRTTYRKAYPVNDLGLWKRLEPFEGSRVRPVRILRGAARLKPYGLRLDLEHLDEIDPSAE
jgi:hypothetical protein